jgi:hypothetical protein
MAERNIPNTLNIVIHRAPVLKLWAATLAERPGFARDGGLLAMSCTYGARDFLRGVSQHFRAGLSYAAPTALVRGGGTCHRCGDTLMSMKHSAAFARGAETRDYSS